MIKVAYKMSQTQKAFFDSKEVVSQMDRTTRKVLSRFGSYVRQRAITNMLRHNPPRGFGVKSQVSNRDGSAPEGMPPYPHTGLLVKFIEFWYDSVAQSVIIGPVRLNGRTAGGEALAALEYGGRTMVLDHKKLVPGNVKPHPYMNPAFEAEKEKSLSRLWENAMTKK